MSDHGQDALRLPEQVDCNDPSGGTDGGAQRHDSRGRFTLADAAAPVVVEPDAAEPQSSDKMSRKIMEELFPEESRL